MTNTTEQSGEVQIDLLLKSKDLADIYLYLDDCTLMYPKLVRPSEEELAKYTKQDCGLEQFDHEFIQQTCHEDSCSGTLLFPLKQGYYLSVEFHS